MRRLWLAAGLLTVAQGILCAHSQSSTPPIQAAQLVREVVYNELHDHDSHGYWRYWIERHTSKESRLDEQVETAEGPIARLNLTNGRSPDAQEKQAEQTRINRLLNSPEELARHRQQYAEDEKRIGRIVALLPDAYLYEYDGEENGCHRLRFQPNPNYLAHSIEARIFHAMSGTLWVDARMKRMARLDGRLGENLEFGYGILGRLYKGGWFQLRRTQVSASDWKTERLEVHMNGRALVFKSIAHETSEIRGGFVPVPAGLNLAQGIALLDRAREQAQDPVQPALYNPAALTVLR
jgi:hypothetical protein